ncbi:TonB-dependent receptor [Sphingomonas populi]|uniref:TonB-dependent receptor n=2 Tax=Sphingomonas populi TaxID=2484750 RepID=A0A4Q6XTD3_9SPHN|nr:TonB-dependent receptor [Sphingomonas populi]
MAFCGQAYAQDVRAPEPAPAAAQDAPVAPQTAPAPAAEAASVPNANAPAPQNSEGLADIVVTAQRRSENLQRAAIAVSVLGGDAIRSANVATSAQLSSLVPALQVSNGNGAYANFYIRGVGNFTGNALTESAIAFNYDGAYVARPSSTAGFFYDLERVEVLKGPQGTLYGRNATGGAINVIPHKADFDWSGYGNVQYGNFNAVQLDGAINAPLASNAGLRISGIYATHDGYMKDGTDDQKDFGMRAQLRWEPTSDLSINIGADYFQQKGKGSGGTPYSLGIDNRYGNFSPQAAALYQTLPHVLGGRTFDPLPDIGFQNNEYYGVNATINYKTDIGNFTVIPSYRHSKLDFTTGNIGFFIMQKEAFNQISLEGRYASPESLPIRVLIGGYYFRERGHDPYNIIQNEFGLVDQTDQRYATNSAAAFGRATYDITQNLRINGGLRYTNERKAYTGDILALQRVCLAGFMQCPNAVAFPNTIAPPPVQIAPNGAVIPQFTADGIGQFGTLVPQDKRGTWNRVTWRAGLDWDVSSRNLLYASFETGFKSGGFFATRDLGTYQPETINAWTVGSKNRFFNNRLQLNLEAFYWKYQDQQISHLGLDSAGSLIFPTENVGRSTMKGVEVESQFLLTRNTLLNANIQYVDAVYDSFVYTTPNAGGTPQTGCGVTPGATGFTVNCSGRRPPQAPAWSVNLGVQQTIPLTNGAKFVFNARSHYQSRTLTGLDFLPNEYQPSYWTGDFQLTYNAPNDRWTIGAYANNIGNATVIGQSYLVTYSAVPSISSILRPPRTYGVRAGVRF